MKRMPENIILALVIFICFVGYFSLGKDAERSPDVPFEETVKPGQRESRPEPVGEVTADDKAEAITPIPKGTLTTEEQVSALLNKGRQAKKHLMLFTCSRRLFDRLSSNEFRLLERLLIMNGASSEIYYVDQARTIILRRLSYSDTAWAECRDEAEVMQALSRFAAERQSAFVLICDAELTASLRTDGRLSNYAAQSGYANTSFTIKNAEFIEASNCIVFNEPYAVVGDAAQFASAVEAFAVHRVKSFYIVLEQAYRERLREDELGAEIMTAASMLENFSGTVFNNGLRHYKNVVYTSEPKAVCYSENDVVDAIRRMGDRNAAAFRLYLVGDLIGPLSDDSFKRLQELAAEAGMCSYKMSCSSSNTLREISFSDARITSHAAVLKSESEAIAYVEEMIRYGAREIDLFCTETLYNTLLSKPDKASDNYTGIKPINDLIDNAGIYDWRATTKPISHVIGITIDQLYPGREITLALESGTEAALSPRLLQTLEEAWSVAYSCRSSDPLETAERIHDAICSRVSYHLEDGKSDCDTAVGVLLNGAADCDGYADAFYLVGTLAGLHVRYQHGDSYDSDPDDEDSPTHMWNLLELDDSWRSVDLTWDDASDKVKMTWFNIGEDRMSRCYLWNREMTVPVLPLTELAERPENEYSVRSAHELEAALENAHDRKEPAFYIIFDNDDYVAREHATSLIKSWRNPSLMTTWDTNLRMLSAYPYW